MLGYLQGHLVRSALCDILVYYLYMYVSETRAEKMNGELNRVLLKKIHEKKYKTVKKLYTKLLV